MPQNINVYSNNKKIILLFALVIFFSMLVNTFHSYLWGPDEPRVAEIARGTFISGNYVTPYLSGKPFLEKPPLYFNMVVCSYALMGDITPGAARLISVLMGCLMLGVAFGVGYCWRGFRAGTLAVLLLIAMPQFYRIAHWIMVDIGIGAFCSLALGLFLYYVYWSKNEQAKWPLYLFYLAASAAFLTKGIIGIFHIGLVIGVFILLRKRWDLLKRMLSPLAMLMFFIPIGIWLYLFYREGGLLFLHEHFINNIIGRLLHVQFTIDGSQKVLTDIGNTSPWYFYLKRLPDMIGGAIIFLPLIIWEGLRKLNILPGKWIVYSDNFRSGSKNKKDIVYRIMLLLLNGKKKKKFDSKQKDIVLFLLLWSFLPAFVLSFSTTKDVTYFLPSYVAIALMAGGWLDERLNASGKVTDALLWLSAIVIPVILADLLLAQVYTVAYIIGVSIWMAAFLPFVIIYAVKLRFVRVVFIICAIILCGIIMGNSPEVMRKTRLNRKCYIDIAKHVFDRIGDKKLHLYRGCETLRGSIPFYGKRSIPVIGSMHELKEVLRSSECNFVLIVDNPFEKMLQDKEFTSIITSCKIQELPFDNLNEEYILIESNAKPVGLNYYSQP